MVNKKKIWLTDWQWSRWQMMCCAKIQKMSAELGLLGTDYTGVILGLCQNAIQMLPTLFCDQLHVSVEPADDFVNLHVIYKLTQMLETCWYESLQGRAGYIIYTYCMYTIKLKALILSIVFNYLRFLMMEIDCTKFFFFYYSLLVHVVARTDENFMDGTPILKSHNCCCSPRCKKKKKEKAFSAVVVCCCPSWMHKLNICNSGFAFICTSDIEHILMV